MAGHLNKTDRVMISCLTDELKMVTYPLEYYNIDRAHILNYVKKINEEEKTARHYRMKYYQDFLDALKEEIAGKYECIFHEDKPTYIFHDMLVSVYSIITEETAKGSDVYINLSAGTMEYCAAASIASMMFEDVKIFTLGGKPEGLTMDMYKKMRESKTRDGKLVGTYFEFKEPYEVEHFKISTPPIKLVKALKVFDTIPLSERTNTNVVRNLVLKDLWKPTDGKEKSLNDLVKDTSYMYETFPGHTGEKRDDNYLKLQRKEAVQYYRNFIEKWCELGWIYNDPNVMGKKYELTSEGKMNLELFCQESVFKFEPEDIVRSK